MDTLAHVNNGRIFSTETFMVAEILLYLPVSVGVNEPVTVANPKLPKVMVDDARETTAASLDAYVHAPLTVEPPNETEGGLTDWFAAP